MPLARDPNLNQFSGRVSDSGEGRWTICGCDRRGRAGSRAECCVVRTLQLTRQADFANQVLSAMRFEFRRTRREEGVMPDVRIFAKPPMS